MRYRDVKILGDAGGEISAANPLRVAPGALGDTTDKSGSITTGGTAQVLAAANSGRVGLFGQNISDTAMWVSETGTAEAGAAGSFQIAAGVAFEVVGSGEVSIICATTGKLFTAVEVT